MPSSEFAPHAKSPDNFGILVNVLRQKTAAIISSSRLSDEEILSRYGAYAIGSFTDMMGWAHLQARSPYAREVIAENLECEKRQDHSGMLFDLLLEAKSLPTRQALFHMGPIMKRVREEQRDPTSIGLFGTMHFAMLENTSLEFIPDIGRRAQRQGATNLTYVEIHGEADIKHARAFIDATQHEAAMGYDYTTLAIRASHLTVDIMDRIYTVRSGLMP
jgi:hypothetical protein